MKVCVGRYHDFCAGHRVHGHEGKCRNLHGHNYRIHFLVEGEQLDEIGRVVDFSVLKDILCQWLETKWDHKFLIWEKDPWYPMLKNIDDKVIGVPFNPTAENMGKYLLKLANTSLLPEGLKLKKIIVEETRKCHAEVECEISN